MVTSRNATISGYRIERVYVSSQEYRLMPPDLLREVAEYGERSVEFGWDWRPIGTRKFEVIVDLELEAVKPAPETAKVRVIGLFEAVDGTPSICFADFVKLNASAILFPFAREVVSTMTGRGPYGAFHVDPLNLVAVLKDTPIEKTTGFQYLEDNPAVAKDFGLEYHAPAGTPSAGTLAIKK